MEEFYKFIIEFLSITKSIWLVLLGAGIAIYAYNRIIKLFMLKKSEKQRNKLRYKNNLTKANALKELYKLIVEISSLHSIYLTEVKYKVSRKQRDSLSEKVENIKIDIIEKLSYASMLIEFNAIENNSIFAKYQKVLFKGFKLWDDYKLINRNDKNFLHRYSKAQLDIVSINFKNAKKYEYMLQKKIGAMGRDLVKSQDPYLDLLEDFGA